MTTLTIGGATKRSKFQPVLVTFGATDNGYAVNDKELPAASVEFIFAYGLKQYLADGAAGAESQDEFIAGVDQRVQNVLTADFKRKAGERGPINDPEVLARKLAKEAWTAIVKKAAADKYKAMSADERDAAYVKSVFGPEGVKFQTFLDQAVEQIAARQAGADEVDLGLD